MRKQLGEAKLVLVCGLIGILGAFLTIISDVILLGRGGNASSFFMFGTEIMGHLESWRITIGTYMGVFVLPFQIFGLATVYYGLKPAGKALSFLTVLIAAHALIMGVAYHVSYAFIGSGWMAHYGIGAGSRSLTELIGKYGFYVNLAGIIILVELLLSSIFFVMAVLKKKTLYSKWMCLFNPIFIYLIMLPLIYFIPSPLGGYIAPTYLNLSTMFFLILSTTVVFKKIKRTQVLRSSS